MQLWQSWKESFLFFLPKNFRLFLLVTLKTMVTAYKTLFTYFWWLFLFTVPAVYSYLSVEYAFYVRFIAINLLLFCYLLATRSSVRKKDTRYFFSYGFYIFYFATTLCFVHALSIVASRISGLTVLYDLIDYGIAAPLFIFVMNFVLDSDGTVSSFFLSWWRALKMVFYNYPLCVISIMILRFLSNFIDWLLITVDVHTIFCALNLKVISLVIPYCFFANVYIKKLHEQFGVYF